MWPSVQRTWPSCSAEHDALSGRGSRLSLGASAYQRIISNNSYAHDEQKVNLGGQALKKCWSGLALSKCQSGLSQTVGHA